MNSDDEQVRKISKMLELGGTMLAEHCNICGSPMFRYHGNVICPVCNVREEVQPAAVLSTSSAIPTQEPMVESRLKSSLSEPPTVPQSKVTSESLSCDTVLPLEELILKKITGIANSMQDEPDPRRVSEQFDIIERGIGIIEQLRNIA